jgi:hypothetical protein
MNKAKHLQGKSRTELTKASFQNKIAEMTRILKGWKKRGSRDDSFWPSILSELAKWDDPDKCIHSWTSPNVTLRSSATYGHLVEAYWTLQDDAAPYLKGDGQETLRNAKKLNQALAQQNTKLTWQVMELRDALKRVDVKNEALTRFDFP